MRERERKIAAAGLCFAALLSALAGCEGAQAGEKKTVIQAAKPQEAEERAALTGDWYGWWSIDKAEGDWAQMDGLSWDCCAEAEEEEKGICLSLWDEDLPKSLLLARLSLREDGEALVCAGGDFLSGVVEEGGCKITLEQREADLSLTIEGSYAALGKGGFDYRIYLKPWGQRWNEEREELPYFYWDWYLPLIESGRAMPDEIG